MISINPRDIGVLVQLVACFFRHRGWDKLPTSRPLHRLGPAAPVVERPPEADAGDSGDRGTLGDGDEAMDWFLPPVC